MNVFAETSADAVGPAFLIAALVVVPRHGRSSWWAVAALVVAASTWVVAPIGVGAFSSAFVHRGMVVFVVVLSTVIVWESITSTKERAAIVLCTSASVIASLVVSLANQPWSVIPVVVLSGLLWRRRSSVPTSIAVVGMLIMTAFVVDARWLDLLGRQVREVGYSWAIVLTLVAVTVSLRSPLGGERIVEIGRAGDLRQHFGRLPGWRVGFATDDGSFRSWTGAAVRPEPGERSAQIGLGGELPEALIVHRDRSVEDPEVRRALVDGLRLLASNVVLARRLDEQSEAVATSRSRLAEAEHRASESLVNDLQRHVLPHLDRINELLDTLPADGRGEVAELLADIKGELVALVDGRRATGGAGSTLRRLEVPGLVEVEIDPAFGTTTADRVGYDEPWHGAAYMVASEGVANALKHGRASRVSVRARTAGDEFVVEVTDDGRGGAELVDGGGLVGLRDRVDRVGGRFVIRTRPGGGTTLIAHLPGTPNSWQGHPAADTFSYGNTNHGSRS